MDRALLSSSHTTLALAGRRAEMRAPAFYACTAPELEGLTQQPLEPEAAFWAPEGDMALLMYDDLRKMDSPTSALLDLLESAHQAGAKTAGWGVEGFRHEPAA